MFVRQFFFTFERLILCKNIKIMKFIEIVFQEYKSPGNMFFAASGAKFGFKILYQQILDII